MIDNNCINGPKSLFRITRDWDEATVEWKSPWANPGGDFENIPLAKNSNDQIKVWEHYDVTNAIKDIVENSGDNYGFILTFDHHTPAYGVMIASSEYSDESKRPKLTIKYDISSHIISQDLKNDNQIMVKRTPGSAMIYLPFEGSCAIIDLQGRQIMSFNATSLRIGQTLAPLMTGIAYTFGGIDAPFILCAVVAISNMLLVQVLVKTETIPSDESQTELC